MFSEEPLGTAIKVQGGYAFKSADFTDRGVPVLKIKNVQHRSVTYADASYVSQDIADEANNWSLKKGDVLICMTGSGPNAPNSVVGRVAQYKYEDDTALFNQRVGRLNLKDDQKADINFVYHVLTSSDYQWRLVHGSTGSANQANISGTLIESLKIPFPPLPEQKAIAHILGTLDDKIELNRKMNQTLEEMARALFKSWFVDFLPVRAKMQARRQTGDPVKKKMNGEPTGLPAEIDKLFPSEMEDSALGKIPKGWRVGKLGEQFKLLMGQSPPGNTYNDAGDGLPFYQGRTDFGFRFPSRRMYCNAPKRIAKAGDTLVSVRAPVGDLNMANEECCIGRGVASVLHHSHSQSYTYYYLHSLQPELQAYESEGTVFGAINRTSFENLDVVEPTKEVIKAYDRIASPIDTKIRVQSEELQTLSSTRDTLLPKLISGQLRVKEAEKFIADV